MLCEPDIFKFTVHPEKQLFFQFKSVKRVEIPVIACHFGKYVHLLSWQKLDELILQIDATLCLYDKYEATASRHLARLGTKTGNRE